MATHIQWFNRHMPNLVVGDWQTLLVYPGTVEYLPESLQHTARRALEHRGTIWVGIRWVAGHSGSCDLGMAWAVVATWPEGEVISQHTRDHWQYRRQMREAAGTIKVCDDTVTVQ